MLESTMNVTRNALLVAGAAIFAFTGCEEDEGPSLPVPQHFIAYPLSDTEVSLSWVCSTSDHEGFRIYRDGGAGFVELTTTPPTWWGYVDSSIVTGTFYTYYVVAYTGGDEGTPSGQYTVEARAPYVTILTPTASETLTLGDMYDVTWTTNDPVFDAQISLSLTGGAPYNELLQFSWAPNTSPWPWKVGYKNTEEDPSLPPVWEQVVFSACATCRLYIYSYESPTPTQGQGEVFTIDVP